MSPSNAFLPFIRQVGVHYELSEEEKFYRNALTRMPDGPAALEEAYNAVEANVGEVEQYVKVRKRLVLLRAQIVNVVLALYIFLSFYSHFFTVLCALIPDAFNCDAFPSLPGVAAVPVLVGHAG